MVKNLPAIQQTLVRALGGEYPLKKERQPTPVFLPGKSYGQRSLVGYSSQDYRRVRHDLVTDTHV